MREREHYRASILDVKATDDEAPLLWGLIPFTATPKTHARIEIRDLESQTGVLPWAVPEIDPKAVVALFVHEDTGAVFDYQDLMANDIGTLPWSEWSTSVGQEQIVLDGNHDNTGVVILISKNNSTPTTTGTLAAICGQSVGLVTCYGGSTATSGLTFIHGYNGGYNGSKPSPQPRQVELVPAGCAVPADYSAPYFTLDGACSAVVRAVVDFGVTGDPRPLNKACAEISGFTWSSGGPDPSLGVWTGSVGLPADGGRQQVNLSTWKSGNDEQGTSGNCANNQPNRRTMSKVAAPYVANTASGPVQYLKLTATHADGVPVGDANSVEKQRSQQPALQLHRHGRSAQAVLGRELRRSAPPAAYGESIGSQNQAWDCDQNINFQDEIRTGVKTKYIETLPRHWTATATRNGTTSCAPAGVPAISHRRCFDGPSPYPSDCVLTETGDKTGQLRDGLHARFETPCVDNNWPDDATEAAGFFGPNGGGYGNDPRYVTLIITDNTAFTGSGNEALPIKYFAGFYVTGWDFHSTQSPGCPDPDGVGPRKGNDCHPVYGCSYQQSLDNGDVWGYFVDLVLFSSSGTPSEDPCFFGGEPAACVPVLVE